MTADRLRTALRGVRGFVLDADGVLVLNGAPLPGSIEAVRGLSARGIPFRVVTNFSQFHRASLATSFGASGLEIDPERIITGTSATAAYTRVAYPGRPLFVLAASDARREFDGQHLLTADEADAAPPGRSPRSSSATPATSCRTGTWTSRSGSSATVPSSWRCTAIRGG